MADKLILTYNDYSVLINKLVDLIKNDRRAQKIKAVYGFPRGGLPIAVHLSHFLKINFSTYPFEYNYEHTLVVDDVADTGVTLSECGNLYLTATLFYKSRSTFKPDIYIQETDKWIVFPWEKEDEIPNR